MTLTRRTLLQAVPLTLPAFGGLAAFQAAAQGGQPASVALDALMTAARKEGRVHSLGMPDDWANWRATWADLQRL